MNFSGFQTRIFEVEGEHVDHLFSLFQLFCFLLKCLQNQTIAYEPKSCSK